MTSRISARFRGQPAIRRRSARLALLSRLALPGLALSGLALAGLGLGGCALQPDPLTRPELEQSVQADLASLYRTEEPLQGPLVSCTWSCCCRCCQVFTAAPGIFLYCIEVCV